MAQGARRGEWKRTKNIDLAFGEQALVRPPEADKPLADWMCMVELLRHSIFEPVRFI